jgi:hypothetical protein
MSASFIFPLFVTGVPTPTMIYSTRVTNNLNEALRVTVNFADFNNDVKSETKNIQPKQSDQFGPEYFKSGGATFRYEVDTLSFRAVDTDKAGYDHEMTRADMYEDVASIVPLMEVSISPDNSNSKGFTVATSVPVDVDLK